MQLIVTILIFITCILLVLIVLVQSSKGGGLSSTFASSTQIMGVRRTADFLEKATWTLAIALLVLSLVSTMTLKGGSEESKQSLIDERINTLPNQSTTDQFMNNTQQEEQKENTEKNK